MPSKGPILVVLVCSLAVGGFLNYRRNAPLDADLTSRRYADLTHEDVETLVVAYEAELQKLRPWAAEEPDASVTRGELLRGDLGGRWQAFERYQGENARWKTRRGVIMERESLLQALRAELDIRIQKLDQPWRRFVRRLITF